MEFLPKSLKMGPVSLRVANPDLMLSFYVGAVGLQVISSGPNSYLLGKGDEPVLVLEHAADLKHAGDREAGLYHTAFLFENKAELAAAVASVATKFPGAFTGSADHLVSEAFYFDDPEHNGVELYVDRPREAWEYRDGVLQMATLQLDPNRFLSEHLKTEASPGAGIGHVHLSVGDLPQAKDFYVDTLGFDLVLNYANSAIFVSAGGYHHHMAMNIWRSRGAGVRQQALGLGEVSIELGSADPLPDINKRLIAKGFQTAWDSDRIVTADPWGNRVAIGA
jgi:catechol 2,3-dioxygenase